MEQSKKVLKVKGLVFLFFVILGFIMPAVARLRQPQQGNQQEPVQAPAATSTTR